MSVHTSCTLIGSDKSLLSDRAACLHTGVADGGLPKLRMFRHPVDVMFKRLSSYWSTKPGFPPGFCSRVRPGGETPGGFGGCAPKARKKIKF